VTRLHQKTNRELLMKKRPTTNKQYIKKRWFNSLNRFSYILDLCQIDMKSLAIRFMTYYYPLYLMQKIPKYFPMLKEAN
jgi:hypothetical protein